MKIVYGVAGEGLGHVFEAIEIVARLRSEGHTVRVLTFGDRAMEVLGFLEPTRIAGIQLYFTPSGMSLSDTVTKNLGIIPFYLGNWRRLRRELVAFAPDVFLTAYEPFTTFAAHRLGKPLISMDNQVGLLYMKAPKGPGSFAFRLARLATRVCTRGARAYVVKSFDRSPRGPANVHFVDPIIQREIRALVPTVGDQVLVYLTKSNPGLVEVLKSIDASFAVYCNDRVGRDANIIFKKHGPEFVNDLGSCRAIIATAGFSLIADSIFLKKPYFAVPLKKQFEQTHNAHFLRESGLGQFSEDPTREDIAAFLGGLDACREKLERHRINPTQQEETLLRLLGEVTAA